MQKIAIFFIVILVVVAGSIFATTATRALLYAPDTEVPAPQGVVQEAPPVMLPTRLQIPAINVDAAVQHVGINQAGNMATPSNFKDVAWYKYGSAPGMQGSAVIAGHLDNGLGLAAVFKRLDELRAGDEIIVTAEDGTARRFVITGSRAYPYDAVPTDVVFDPSGSARLNLITCAGEWMPELKTYDERLVVFAQLAE